MALTGVMLRASGPSLGSSQSRTLTKFIMKYLLTVPLGTHGDCYDRFLIFV
jgi:NADH:ubiquinone oxidoreductase subunit D